MSSALILLVLVFVMTLLEFWFVVETTSPSVLAGVTIGEGAVDVAGALLTVAVSLVPFLLFCVLFVLLELLPPPPENDKVECSIIVLRRLIVD